VGEDFRCKSSQRRICIKHLCDGFAQ
jgi:hypothetical protein